MSVQGKDCIYETQLAEFLKINPSDLNLILDTVLLEKYIYKKVYSFKKDNKEYVIKLRNLDFISSYEDYVTNKLYENGYGSIRSLETGIIGLSGKLWGYIILNKLPYVNYDEFYSKQKCKFVYENTLLGILENMKKLADLSSVFDENTLNNCLNVGFNMMFNKDNGFWCLCHNALNNTNNILLDNDSNVVQLIDFEDLGFNLIESNLAQLYYFNFKDTLPITYFLKKAQLYFPSLNNELIINAVMSKAK